jgi:hypothetical protein
MQLLYVDACTAEQHVQDQRILNGAQRVPTKQRQRLGCQDARVGIGGPRAHEQPRWHLSTGMLLQYSGVRRGHTDGVAMQGRTTCTPIAAQLPGAHI